MKLAARSILFLALLVALILKDAPLSGYLWFVAVWASSELLRFVVTKYRPRMDKAASDATADAARANAMYRAKSRVHPKAHHFRHA
jgi:hypothetical protein